MATKTASETRNAPVGRNHSVYQTETDHEQTDMYVIEFVDDLFKDLRHDNMFKRLTKVELLELVHDYINEQEEYLEEHFGKYSSCYKFDPTKQEDMDGVMNFICKYYDKFVYTDDEEEEDEYWIDYYSEKSQAEANYQ